MSDLVAQFKSALADRYTIGPEIGRGGMAVVFRAEDLRHHRQVAIKVLQPELTATLGAERFLQEIEIVAGLQHPHILPLYHSGEAAGLLYYVMPYIEGESLRQRLDREKQLPVDEAVSIAVEVADGLDHAHRKGVVHRDIKPGNILLSDGHATIADFGIARALEAARRDRITSTGLGVGTPLYTSSEQAAGGTTDARSDIYSLGCVLYEMLAGEPPFTGPTPQAILARQAAARPTPLPVVRDTVPGALDAVVGRALSRTPADRHRSAREFADALRSAMRSDATPAPGGSQPGEDRRRRAVRWASIAAVTVLLALVIWQGTRPAQVDPESDLKSIAVLPFVNMSSDPEQEYFSDGISGTLINYLGRVPQLQVAARTSSFSFKGEGLELPEIADRLNVEYVLEGSVQKAGNQVRIAAELIRADGFQVWSKDWSRSLDAIFAIQEEIADEVVAQLKITLLGMVRTAEKTDPEAYALYLQARYLDNRFNAQSARRAHELYQQVLTIDPDYAQGWAGLAGNLWGQTWFPEIRPPEESIRLASEAAERALEIDPECAEAYRQLGVLASRDLDLTSAAQYIERAFELGPTDPDINREAAWVYLSLGRLEDAVALQEYVVARDPVNPIAHSRLGILYRFAGRLDESLASLRTALTLSPDRIGAHEIIGSVLLLKGDPEAALEEIQQEPDERYLLIGLPPVYHALGREAESDAALEELIEKYSQEWAYQIAGVFAYRGEADSAFAWLDRALEYGDAGLNEITVEPLFANIHDDPRWLPFLESIGKSPEQLAAIHFEVPLPQQ